VRKHHSLDTQPSATHPLMHVPRAAVQLEHSYFRSDDRPDKAAGDHAMQVGRSLADVERDLILVTLRHCLGNRTHTAGILGISLRTLRNKLNEYASQGMRVPPPGGGET
jgi:DNA-binding NtrC family response regulator